MVFRPLLPLLFGVVLGAQVAEDATLGVQVRGSVPMGDLRDALGGFRTPGAGISVVAEQDLGLPMRVRLDLGLDRWPRKSSTLGTDAQVQALHLSLEGVYLLRDDGDEAVALGPYVVLGVGGYGWDMKTEGQGSRRVIHAAATFGFGWRLTRSLDAEVKLLAGPMDAQRTASAVLAGATLRF